MGMKRLGDGEAISLRARVRDLLDVTPGWGAFFKPAFLRGRRFHSVLFEGDFRDADEGVSGLCQTHSVACVFCLDISDDANLPSFRFAPTHDTLKAVRREYHTPSYAIGDEAGTFLLVSDSDYFWGFAAAPALVATLAARNADLRQTRDAIRGFLDSEDAHNQRIGAMLRAFLDVCDGADTLA